MNPNDALRLAQQALAKAQETTRQNEAFLRSIGPALINAITPMLKSIQTTVSNMKVTVAPNVTVNPKVEMPTFTVPDIYVPAPEVTVNVPEIKIPPIVIPPVTIPENLKSTVQIIGWDSRLLAQPIPVQIRDAKGNPVMFGGMGGNSTIEVGGGGPAFITLKGILASAFYDTGLISGDNRLRVTSDSSASGSGGSVFATLATADGIPYSGDNPVPVTFSAASVQPVSQVSGASWSVEATIPATIGVTQVSGASFSVNVLNSQGGSVTATLATNDGVSYSGDNPVPTYMPSTLDVRQVSGANWSVSVAGYSSSVFATPASPDGVPYNTDNPQPVTLPSTIDVRQVSGAMWSVSVSDIFGTTAANLVNPDGRLKVSADVSGAVAGSVFATPATADGVPYSADNPMPVYLTSGASATTAVMAVDSSGVAYSGSNPLPVTGSFAFSADKGQGDAGTALRVVVAGNSDMSTVALDGFNGAPWVNKVSGYNSTTAVLTNGAVFTGLAEFVPMFATAQVYVFADQVSATDGLSIQQSSDGTNWDIVDTYTIPASTGKAISVQIAGQYFRVVYTNGGVTQGAFRLMTIYHVTTPKSSSQRPQDGLSNENDFEMNISMGHAFNGSTWDRIRNTSGEGNALRVQAATDSIFSVTIQGGQSSSTVLYTRQTNPSAIASDYVPQAADDVGRTLTRPIQVRDLIRTAYVALSTGTETTLFTATAGTFADLIMVTATNASTAATQLDIRAVTAGNIIHTMYLPATTGPVGFTPQVPWPQDATGRAWTIDMPDQTGTTVYVSALFSQEV